MTSPPLACPRCQAELLPTDVRCPACGATTLADSAVNVPQIPASVVTSPVAPAGPKRRAVIDNPYAVLAAVFLAMAVFGIPLIWMSRAWSTPTKVVLTLVTLAYTVLILWLFSLVMLWCYERISSSF
jgi:hypothetical protein